MSALIPWPVQKLGRYANPSWHSGYARRNRRRKVNAVAPSKSALPAQVAGSGTAGSASPTIARAKELPGPLLKTS